MFFDESSFTIFRPSLLIVVLPVVTEPVVYRIAFDGRLVVTGTNGNLVVYFDAVQIFEIFRQLDVEACTVAVVDDADVVVREVVGISAAFELHRIGVLPGYLIIGTAVTFEYAAGRFNGCVDVADLFGDAVGDVFQLTFRSSPVFNDTGVSRIPFRVVETGNVFTALGIRRAVRFSTFYGLVSDGNSALSGITDGDQTVVAVHRDFTVAYRL